MFTGIVVGTGRVVSSLAQSGDVRLAVDAPGVDAARLALGDSVSVQGVCLTVTRRSGSVFEADVSRETLSKTTLGALGAGARVNLEPALRVGDALGGHWVTGHVDAVGRVVAAAEDARSWRIEFEVPAELARFIARKGSVTIDGVSLTVNEVDGRRFGVNLIPHTVERTTFHAKRAGDAVNIEVDVIARYVERLVGGGEAPKLDEAFLKQHGFA